MRVEFFKYYFSTFKIKNENLWKHAWREIWEFEISRWPAEYCVYFNVEPNFTLKTSKINNWVFSLVTSTGRYTVYANELTEKTDLDIKIDDWEIYQQLQQCHDDKYKFFFNGKFQGSVGHILDVLIYIADQSDNVINLYPLTKEEFEQERREYFKNKK